jgi:DNA polymerase V
MVNRLDYIPDDDFYKANPSLIGSIPFFDSLVLAGFSSPATDHIEKACSLDDLCISHLNTTYFARCWGDSMMDDGLWDGDIMIIDRTFDPDLLEGRMVIAWYNGGRLVKRYHKKDGFICLMPANPQFAPIYIREGDKFRVFGIVTFWLRKAAIKRVF